MDYKEDYKKYVVEHYKHFSKRVKPASFKGYVKIRTLAKEY